MLKHTWNHGERSGGTGQTMLQQGICKLAKAHLFDVEAMQQTCSMWLPNQALHDSCFFILQTALLFDTHKQLVDCLVTTSIDKPRSAARQQPASTVLTYWEKMALAPLSEKATRHSIHLANTAGPGTIRHAEDTESTNVLAARTEEGTSGCL